MSEVGTQLSSLLPDHLRYEFQRFMDPKTKMKFDKHHQPSKNRCTPWPNRPSLDPSLTRGLPALLAAWATTSWTKAYLLSRFICLPAGVFFTSQDVCAQHSGAMHFATVVGTTHEVWEV